MELKIIFYKSSSASYNLVISKCQNFQNFSQEKYKNILIVSFFELSEQYNSISYIIDKICYWKKTEFYLDYTQINPSEMMSVLKIIKCQNDFEKSKIHCFEKGGAGCTFLENVQFKNNYYCDESPYWFDFGYYDGSKWIIDKDKILEAIEKEVLEKKLSLCRFFSYDNVFSIINELPEEIIVTEKDNCKWEFKYDYSFVGQETPKVIGISLKSDKLYQKMFELECEWLGKEQDDNNVAIENDYEKKIILAFRKCSYDEKMGFITMANEINSKD